MNSQAETPVKILVWDISTRFFHWAIALLFVALLVSGLSDNIDWMTWHQRFGYMVLGLLIFRCLIGIWGQDYARFTRLPLNFSAIKAYLQGRYHSLGHNPLGSWMVVVMLLTLAAQVLSGFLATDDFFVEGPWVFWADEEWVSLATSIHAQNWIFMSLLVGVHLLAIGIYRFVKKQNLVTPMVSGYKTLEHKQLAEQLPSAASHSSVTRLSIFALISAGLTWLLIELPAIM